jgi:hypothetical protein
MRARWRAEIVPSRDGDRADRQRGKESSDDGVNSTREMLNLLARRIRALREKEPLAGAIRRWSATIRSLGVAYGRSRELGAYAFADRFAKAWQSAAVLRPARDPITEMPVETAEERISTRNGVNV